jgi:hypothetical protein
MTQDNSSSVDSTSNEKRKFITEIVILSSIFVGLTVLAVTPFGFRTVLNGLGHESIFSLLLVVSAIGVVLVIMQRIGLIFPDVREG